MERTRRPSDLPIFHFPKMTQLDMSVNESIVASNLCTELSACFPEIAEEIESNRELPYLQMHTLGDWLAGLPEDQLPGLSITHI